ncbi:TPA: restriction endonuclease subunit S [Vibrio parahaemolyticus]|nr:restriction endonuclease subunit S [Vibrio parahaemolyticus]
MSNLNRPLIRFTQYSDSWKLRPLSELIASVDSGWSPQCDDGSASKGEWGVLKTTSIQWTGFEPKQNKKLPNTLEPRAKLSLSKNDILVTRAGPNERVGVVSIVNQDYPMLMLSDKIIRLRANAEVDPSYLALNLSLKKSNYQIMRKASGLATSQTNISQGFLLQTKLNVPELAEQQKIASFLSKVDEKITLLTEKKAKLTEYKKGVMQQLFDGSFQEQDGKLVFVPPTLRFKEDDGSDFPDWEEKKFDDISDIKRGASPRPISDPKWFDANSNVGWVRISDVTRSGRELLKTEQYLTEEGIKKSRLIPVGSMIMSICATIGKPIYTTFPVCIHDGFVVFSNLSVQSEYIYYYLVYIEKNWYRFGQPGSQVNLNTDIVGNEIVRVPSQDEQIKIVNFLSAIDQKIDLASSELEKAKEWKKGLLQQMFV